MNIRYQRYLRDLFPKKLFEDQQAFKALVRLSLPKQPPLALAVDQEDEEEVDISQYLQLRQMCSGGAVSQCLKYLLDDTVCEGVGRRAWVFGRGSGWVGEGTCH